MPILAEVRAQALKAPQDAPLTAAQRDAAWPAGEGAASDASLTTAQRDALRGAGCEEGQGYLFSPPLDAQAFRDWLAQQPRT